MKAFYFIYTIQSSNAIRRLFIINPDKSIKNNQVIIIIKSSKPLHFY